MEQSKTGLFFTIVGASVLSAFLIDGLRWACGKGKVIMKNEALKLVEEETQKNGAHNLETSEAQDQVRSIQSKINSRFN